MASFKRGWPEVRTETWTLNTLLLLSSRDLGKVLDFSVLLIITTTGETTPSAYLLHVTECHSMHVLTAICVLHTTARTACRRARSVRGAEVKGRGRTNSSGPGKRRETWGRLLRERNTWPGLSA